MAVIIYQNIFFIFAELSDDPEVSFYVDRDVESYSKIVVDTVRQQVIVGAM